MKGFKFDISKLEKLNDPERLKDIPPEYIWDKLQLQNPRVLLDIGAGTGFFSKEFVQMTGVDQVYALDIADEMIEWMEEHLVADYPGVKPMKMEESSVPLSDRIADGIIMINLHHEFHEPDTFLQECYRLLNNKGKMAIVDWAKKETEHGPPVSKRYSISVIINQLKKAGFQNVESYEELPSHFLILAEKNENQ